MARVSKLLELEKSSPPEAAPAAAAPGSASANPALDEAMDESQWSAVDKYLDESSILAIDDPAPAAPEDKSIKDGCSAPDLVQQGDPVDVPYRHLCLRLQRLGQSGAH